MRTERALDLTSEQRASFAESYLASVDGFLPYTGCAWIRVFCPDSATTESSDESAVADVHAILES